jgi:hypothetical protein
VPAPRHRSESPAQPHWFGIGPPQTSVIVAVTQERLQPPQLVLFADTERSQPSSAVGAAGCVQFAKPSTHVDTHAPDEHARDETFCVPHALPHAPQCSGSLVVFASQPSSLDPGCGPLQSLNGAPQVGWHWPPEQLREVTFTVEQAPPHVPQ